MHRCASMSMCRTATRVQVKLEGSAAAEVAVVTGASRGIGRAIALALGGEGAKV